MAHHPQPAQRGGVPAAQSSNVSPLHPRIHHSLVVLLAKARRSPRREAELGMSLEKATGVP